MGRKKFAQLTAIEHADAAAEPEFLDVLKRGLLLALLEKGTLHRSQYRRAVELLLQRKSPQAKR